MLHLVSSTRDSWAKQAVENLECLLIDHAHCEKKAASTAINLIFRYGDQVDLMAPLSAMAREELAHFEMVLGVLSARGILFRRQEPSPYAPRLMKYVRRGEPDRLMDTLLCCSLIEARSCERIRILSEVLRASEPDLADMYGALFESEARHHASFVSLALRIFPKAKTMERLKELAVMEADILASSSENDPLRFHS